MIAKINSCSLFGIDAFRVSVEVSVSNGLGYMITGLPDDSIKESLSRIAVAIQNTGFHMPRTKLMINLGPAGIRKVGAGFDLPIALGILLATEQLKDLRKLENYIVTGELGLDGSISAVRGALCMAYQARQSGFKSIILPVKNSEEAALVSGIQVFGVRNLEESITFIQSESSTKPNVHTTEKNLKSEKFLDFSEVKGQHQSKRALEIAAAGGHNTLLIGAPGNGKTMLAKRLPSILPPMTDEEALETTRIHSINNNRFSLEGLIAHRPFRSPHHTTSDAALAGGGSDPTPGEISHSHNGVLFLDELPEFKRSVLDVLRQPMEERKISIARAKCSIEYPASFTLIAAMNPCPCGYLGHSSRSCSCSKYAIYRYRRRISGPIMDRIDLQVETESRPVSEVMISREIPETSSVIRERVVKARKIQSNRFTNESLVYCNAQMPDHLIEKFCALDEHARRFLFSQMDKFQLSVRSYTRILKVARTIADLAGKENIDLQHIAEALSFRTLDKPLMIPIQNIKMKTAMHKPIKYNHF